MVLILNRRGIQIQTRFQTIRFIFVFDKSVFRLKYGKSWHSVLISSILNPNQSLLPGQQKDPLRCHFSKMSKMGATRSFASPALRPKHRSAGKVSCGETYPPGFEL